MREEGDLRNNEGKGISGKRKNTLNFVGKQRKMV